MRKRGFTLIELLIVVGIISLLISLLMPALSSAREQTRRTVCMSNLRQLATGIYNYWSAEGSHVPYVTSPMVNNVFGNPSVPDKDADPFDRTKWAQSLPNVLMPSYMGESPGVFVCPSAINGWPREEGAEKRFTYRDAAANQPGGTVLPPGDYLREAFAFLDGRVLHKFKMNLVTEPKTYLDHIHNGQEESKARGTYLRDLVLMRATNAEPVVGPHRGGIMVLNRELQVEFRDQKTATEDLSPTGQGVKF